MLWDSDAEYTMVAISLGREGFNIYGVRGRERTTGTLGSSCVQAPTARRVPGLGTGTGAQELPSLRVPRAQGLSCSLIKGFHAK